jgi:TIR domain
MGRLGSMFRIQCDRSSDRGLGVTLRTLDDVWDDIVATLELGSGLRFVLIEADSGQARTNLRRRLQRYLKTQEKSLQSPPAGTNGLDWLSKEQTPPGMGAPSEETRWLSLPGKSKERFFLHRLNEGRDNLRRTLGGVLFLIGSRGMLQRLGNDAPDLWSVRELAVELDAQGREEKPQATAQTYDVYLSYSRYDASFAIALRKQMEEDGLRVLEVSDDVLPEYTFYGYIHRFAHLNYYIFLLSPPYVRSKSLANEMRSIRFYKHAVYPNSFIPLMIRDTVLPPDLRHLAYLDFRTPDKIAANYPRLLQILKSPTL